MANYTDRRDELAAVVTPILERQILHGALAQKVAIELGYILEPLIEQKIREALNKAQVKF